MDTDVTTLAPTEFSTTIQKYQESQAQQFQLAAERLRAALTEGFRLAGRAQALGRGALALPVASDVDLATAGTQAKETSKTIRDIKRLFETPKRDLDTLKRFALDAERVVVGALQQADTHLRTQATTYETERRKREAERKRLEEAESVKRREDEKLAEAARLENMAVATGDAHYQRAAEQVLSQPVRPATVVVKAPKVDGFSFREEVDVAVEDATALVQAVAAGTADIQALMANVTWLRNEAKQRAGALADGDWLFPGVRVIKRPDVTVR